MVFNHTAAKRQPQAGALEFGGIKRAENGAYLAVAHPRAGIDDLYADLVLAIGRRLRHQTHRDRELAPSRHGLEGIFQEVEKQLLDLSGVNLTRREGIIKLPQELDVALLSFALDQGQHLGQRTPQVGGGETGPWRAGE